MNVYTWREEAVHSLELREYRVPIPNPLGHNFVVRSTCMSLTSSTMLPLKTTAPNFSLPDLDGTIVSLNDYKKAKAYIIAFICVHCPYVKHLENEFAALALRYKEKGVAVIAINSNDPNYDLEDSLEGMKKQATKYSFSFPYLVDESQKIAQSYLAACTPDFYVFDKNKKLIYRGQFDDSRPGQGRPSGESLEDALNTVLNNQPSLENQKPSSGCNIKWKPGNEPV